MIGELTNHLWQSTVFAVAVALLTLAFRKNRAQVRYWLWLGASLKFLIPFSLLIGLGDRLWDSLTAGKIAAGAAAPAVSQAMMQITEPFSGSSSFAPAAPHATNWIPIAALGVWACGFAGVVLMRIRAWLRVHYALRASSPVKVAIPAAIAVRSTPSLLEPGVVGFLRPVLLLPEGILENLTPPQLEAVLAHEQCHVRRRDNLNATIHMLVEAVFWFYPVVWWIGAKLIEERERACDEAVLALGNQPEIYVEGILNVCRSYLESPLRCVSGVTGSDLKKRIRAIMAGQLTGGLSSARKAALAIAAVAAVAAPIVAGIIGAPSIRAQSQTQGTGAKIAFDVASIRRLEGIPDNTGITTSGPRLDAVGERVSGLIVYAYDLKGYQLKLAPENIWYDVHAEAGGDVTPTKDEFRRMMQSLLADRFSLKFHYETQEMQTYDLVVGKHGPKFKESDPKAFPSGYLRVDGPNETMTLSKETMEKFVAQLRTYTQRPVMDKTGLTGAYDINFEAAVRADPDAIDVFGAVQQQLGLKLVPQKAMIKVLVVDHVEKPTAN